MGGSTLRAAAERMARNLPIRRLGDYNAAKSCAQPIDVHACAYLARAMVFQSASRSRVAGREPAMPALDPLPARFVGARPCHALGARARGAALQRCKAHIARVSKPGAGARVLRGSRQRPDGNDRRLRPDGNAWPSARSARTPRRRSPAEARGTGVEAAQRSAGGRRCDASGAPCAPGATSSSDARRGRRHIATGSARRGHAPARAARAPSSRSRRRRPRRARCRHQVAGAGCTGAIERPGAPAERRHAHDSASEVATLIRAPRLARSDAVAQAPRADERAAARSRLGARRRGPRVGGSSSCRGAAAAVRSRR